MVNTTRFGFDLTRFGEKFPRVLDMLKKAGVDVERQAGKTTRDEKIFGNQNEIRLYLPFSD